MSQHLCVWSQDDATQVEELEEQMAPDSAVQEEHRLRAQREAAEAQEVRRAQYHWKAVVDDDYPRSTRPRQCWSKPSSTASSA